MRDRTAGPSRSPISAAPSDQGDAKRLARLIEAGQAAERLGQRTQARECFEAALHCLDTKDAGVQSAALFRWIARTYMTDGDPAAAMDCANVAFAVAEAWGDNVGQGHANNAQAAIRWAQGDLDGAEALFRLARTRGMEAEERALIAMTSANLGIIANIRGDLADALHHYSVGLEHYRALNRRHEVITALNNMGRLHTDLERWTDAARAYSEAIEIANAIGDRTARIGLEVNVAELCIARGDTSGAVAAVDNAAAVSSETGDAAWLAQIEKLRGILHRDAGDSAAAEAAFARAAELCEARQDLLLLAETLRARAELYQRDGRNRESLENLNRAHQLFTQLRAKRELANVDRSVARLEDDFTSFVRRWGESIEAKDRYTQGHCERVATVSCAIAAACGLDEQSLFWFRIGALLHDVGKIGVPSEILNKPGKLTQDEWAVMRSHPSAGVEMLAGIDFPWDVRPIIESHHERWDGAGYPHGLRGEAIPLSARILAVADVYDALTSLRSYKASLSHESALEIMRRDVGSAFDPDVFAKFETVIDDILARRNANVESTEEPADIGERSLAKRALELVTDDPVTGLPLRESLERIAAQALADRQVTSGLVSLLVIELDQTGWSDPQQRRLLRWIADELRGATRTSDFVARTDEQQFMALLPQASARQASAVMTRVRSALVRRLRVHRHGSSVMIRSAVVTAPDSGETVDELLRAAQRACLSSVTQSRTRAG
jgi:putative nucleotidyltransferase with HDIG domain/diguanylate cyclase (GGDEF)-like protein